MKMIHFRIQLFTKFKQLHLKQEFKEPKYGIFRAIQHF